MILKLKNDLPIRHGLSCRRPQAKSFNGDAGDLQRGANFQDAGTSLDPGRDSDKHLIGADQRRKIGVPVLR